MYRNLIALIALAATSALLCGCGATAAPAREAPGEGAGAGTPAEQDGTEECPLGCFLNGGACVRVAGQDVPPAANEPVDPKTTRDCPTRCCPRQSGGPDQDGDGIADRVDRCPTTPEDRDGFEDADGCAEPDNDGDGLLDTRDKCPNEAGPEPSGCP